MDFGILGPLEVRAGGRSIDLGRPKQRAVLAVLLIEANRVVPLDRLIDLLWHRRPPTTAAGALQVYVSGLRAALEPDRPARMRTNVLVTQAPGYLLAVAPSEFDAARFESLAVEGRRLLTAGRPAAARHALAAGLELWRGAALAEFLFEPFAQTEAARLEELRATAHEDRIEADLALGNHTALTAELESLVAGSPLRERLWAMLMLALYRSERQGEALRAVARARAILREQLGVEPGPLVRRLEADVLDHAPCLGWQPPDDERPSVPVRVVVGGQAPSGAAGDAAGDAAAEATGRSGEVIGRDDELAAMERFLALARAGRGGLVLVSGEPGIGKTRLVEEFAGRAVAAGAFVAWGACYEGEGAPSFWPWVQVIRGILLGIEEDTLRRALGAGAGEIAQIAPEVKEVAPEFDPPLVLDPAAARFRLYQAVTALLTDLAGSVPVVIVIDDLHWADVPSLRLAEFVAAHTAQTSLVLVATFRDVDPAVGGALADTLGVLARQPSLHRAALEGLSQADCVRFIAAAFGVTPTDALAETVHARTDGNPFFVAEVARMLASEGGLHDDESPRPPVPAGVRDIIRRRLSRLPKRTVDLIAQAAVLGREVELPMLAFTGRIDEAEVAGLVDTAVATGILVRVAAVPGRYRFFHALVQETVLGDLGLLRAAKLHARAAAALRVIHGDDDGHAIELAHHLYSATPVARPEEAYDAAVRASEVSLKRLAYEQAEHQLRRALELVGRMAPGPDRSHRELEVQHRLATMLSVTVGYGSGPVEDAWRRAQELCADLGDTPEVLASLWGLARLSRSRSEFDVCTELGRQLLDLSRRSATPTFAIAGHECSGLPALFTAHFASAATHLAEAVALSDEAMVADDAGSGVLYPAISCRSYLACVRWMQGAEDEAVTLTETARAMAAASGHLLTRAIAELYAAMLATWRDRPEEARVRTGEVEALIANGPIGTLEPISAVLAGWADAKLGDAAGGAARIVAATAQLRAGGWRLAMSYFAALRADAHLLAGHRDQARADVAAGLAEVEATGERFYEGELCRRAGELSTGSDAEEWLRRAVEVATRQGPQVFLERAEASLARTLSAWD